MSINNIKYFPDKFYIRFDDDVVDNLLHLDCNNQYGVELSVFIHEFYHYLANITTFLGNLPVQLPLTTVWHNALNDLSLYALYLDYRKTHP